MNISLVSTKKSLIKPLRQASVFALATLLAVQSLLSGTWAFSVVDAATTNEVATPVNMQGWTTYGDATATIIDDANAFAGSSSLAMSASTNGQYAMVWKDAIDTTVKASTIDLHYTSKRLSGPAHAAPSYVILVDPDGNTATDDSFYALYEPVYDHPAASTNYDQWNTWNITPASKFWYTSAYGPRPVEAVNYTPLSNLLVHYPNATILATTLNIGSGNNGWSVLVDNVKTTDDIIYDFERASIAPCTTTSNLHTTSLTTWDLTQTRATGHNELVVDGLNAWTEGTTSTDKAAGYYSTDFALSEAGIPNIEFSSYTGGRPSLQLGVDKDANGTWDGYLVYEPWAYGVGKFWSNGNFGISSGMGYNSFGTLEDYLNANPTARVTSIGYSLGSGVLGQATITKLSAGCVEYTFGLPVDNTAPSVPTITAPGARQWFNGASTLNSWTASTDDSGVIAEYQVKYQFDGRPDAFRSVAGNQTSRTQTFTGSYQGPITISVRARDEAGNWSDFSAPVTYYYDSISPSTDINVSPVVEGVFTVSGTATDNLRLNRVYVQLVSRVTNQRCGGTTISFVDANTNTSAWSKTYDITTLGANCPEGNFAAHVEVADMAGNRGTAGWTPNFMVEAPAVLGQCTTADPSKISAIALNATIGRDGTVTVTNLDQDCTHTVTFVSYKGYEAYQGEANLDWLFTQTLHQAIRVDLTPGQTTTLQVGLPMCTYQLDLFYGDYAPAHFDAAVRSYIRQNHLEITSWYYDDQLEFCVAGEGGTGVEPTPTPTPETTPTPTPEVTPTPTPEEENGQVEGIIDDKTDGTHNQQSQEEGNVLSATGGQSLIALGLALSGLGSAGFVISRKRKTQA